MYKSHSLSRHTLLKSRVSHTPVRGSSRSYLFFRHHTRAQLFSHTSPSFVLSSATKYIKHSDLNTPQLYSTAL